LEAEDSLSEDDSGLVRNDEDGIIRTATGTAFGEFDLVPVVVAKVDSASSSAAAAAARCASRAPSVTAKVVAHAVHF
jgi:hypothetical protein